MSNVLVPVEPTDEMIAAGAGEGVDAYHDMVHWVHIARRMYSAILAAAPSAQERRRAQRRHDADPLSEHIRRVGLYDRRSNAAATQGVTHSNDYGVSDCGEHVCDEAQSGPSGTGSDAKQVPASAVAPESGSPRAVFEKHINGGYTPATPEPAPRKGIREDGVCNAHDIFNCDMCKSADAAEVFGPSKESNLPLNSTQINGLKVGGPGWCGNLSYSMLCDQALRALDLELDNAALQHDIARATQRNSDLLAENAQLKADLVAMGARK